ncbi:hypothetical protein B14911_18110 [Bacillus sp. NRRL B-14911]|uniref:Uncharacterized protein n=1 Tax=Bacillus infantis NRRL B-14911 TaxID=1367477 RepID=U5L7A4_9BACI|nr:hypothetical protein N288_02920 [Bacillus infantis NRRL B-14911]EAR67335.1 hypothetical protein B14911_18110 [Bacillus sp. NRRL B-14911]
MMVNCEFYSQEWQAHFLSGCFAFFASVLLLVHADLLTIIKSSTLSKWLCIAGGTVFLLRAIEKGQGDRPLGSKKPRDLSPWFKNIL